MRTSRRRGGSRGLCASAIIHVYHFRHGILVLSSSPSQAAIPCLTCCAGQRLREATGSRLVAMNKTTSKYTSNSRGCARAQTQAAQLPPPHKPGLAHRELPLHLLLHCCAQRLSLRHRGRLGLCQPVLVGVYPGLLVCGLLVCGQLVCGQAGGSHAGCCHHSPSLLLAPLGQLR